MRERERDIILMKLDLSKDLENLLARKKEEDPLLESITHVEWAVFELSENKFFAINTEGVGPEDPITNDNPLVVGLFKTQRKEADSEFPQSVEFFPSSQWHLTASDIQNHLGENVNLADHVRTFGHRLEGNFWMWYRKLIKENERKSYGSAT